MRKLLILLGVLLPFTAWAAPQPVTGEATNSGTVNSSTTITLGGTFQQILPSISGTSTLRRSLTIQNNNTGTDACWLHIGTGTPTLANSILLAAPMGAYVRYWPNVPSDAFQVTCTTTNDTIYVDTQ